MSDLRITCGNDYQLKLVYKDANGFVLDITGGSARLMVRKDHYSTVVVTKTATVNGAAGEIIFNLVPLDTSTILTDKVSDEYLYDVELTEASGKITTILSGEVTFFQPVTRD